MLVVDASAIVDLVLGTERGVHVRSALVDVRELHAPELIEPETLAALRRWRARGWISSGAADRALHMFGLLPLARHSHVALRASIWALRDRCSTYDACYVALAQAFDAPLLTTDDRLARAVADFTDLVELA
jgi:predicted nucleic acid-binding protein